MANELVRSNGDSQAATSLWGLISQWNFVPQRKLLTDKDLRTYIAPVQLTRIRQDVQTWRQGVQEAENAWYPQRVKIQQLLIDTVLNGHVEACMNRRRNITLLRKFKFVDKNGKENEEVTNRFAGKQWFHNFMHYVLDAQFYGYSLIQLEDIINSEVSGVNIVPRWFVSPDRFNVVQFIYSISGVPFLEEPFCDHSIYVASISEDGVSPAGYGLLYKVGLYEIILRNLLGFNSDYVEVFGSPLRWAKTDKTQSDPERQILEQAMREMGSTNYIITSPQEELTFLAPQKGTGENPYENLEKRCEAKISKILLGHADALDSTPGKLGAEDSVTEALEDIQAKDGMFVTNVVQTYLLPKLAKLGIGIPDGLTMVFCNDKEEQEQRIHENTQNKLVADTIQVLALAGFDADPAWFTERTGIPVVKKEVVEVDPTPQQIKNKLKELYEHNHVH